MVDAQPVAEHHLLGGLLHDAVLAVSIPGLGDLQLVHQAELHEVLPLIARGFDRAGTAPVGSPRGGRSAVGFDRPRTTTSASVALTAATSRRSPRMQASRA